MKIKPLRCLCFYSGFCALFLLVSTAAPGQLIVADTVNGTPAQQALVLARILEGNCVTVSNASLTCGAFGWGTFNGTSVFLGMPHGVLLTNGRLDHATGPNNNPSSGEDRGQPGHPELDLLAAPNQTRDACVLEFDVVPATDSLSVSYVVASDEYPEFTCSPATDVFAIFLSGPGITGNVPGNPNLRNIAMVPNTSQMASINTIRPQNPDNASCTPQNEQFYESNGTGSTPAINTQMQYDGYTKTLVASITGLVPNAAYRIKFGVADVLDGFIDTGLFLAQGSLNSSALPGCTTMVAVPGHLQYKAVKARVHPNPAAGQAQLLVSGLPAELAGAEVRVTDVLGRVLLQAYQPALEAGTLQMPLNIAALHSGIYTYSVLSQGKPLATGRFVVAQ